MRIGRGIAPQSNIVLLSMRVMVGRPMSVQLVERKLRPYARVDMALVL